MLRRDDGATIDGASIAGKSRTGIIQIGVSWDVTNFNKPLSGKQVGLIIFFRREIIFYLSGIKEASGLKCTYFISCSGAARVWRLINLRTFWYLRGGEGQELRKKLIRVIIFTHRTSHYWKCY